MPKTHGMAIAVRLQSIWEDGLINTAAYVLLQKAALYLRLACPLFDLSRDSTGGEILFLSRAGMDDLGICPNQELHCRILEQSSAAFGAY